MGTNWIEFCERHSKASSSDFARSCVQFIYTNLPENERNSTGLSHKEFLAKFIECFSENFEHEFYRRSIQHENKVKAGNGAAVVLEESDYSEDQNSPKTNHRPFFRRLSFKGLKKGKAFFHKQHSDEVELSGARQSKTKLAKIVVECRKEGIANYIPPESLEQPSDQHRWQKCKLVLVKTVGGYMLEFYSPPKSPKPRNGVFCFLISEARETTALEMPDHENTFVLKTDNNMEYVIEAKDTDDMRSWLATIRYCMKSTPTSQLPPSSLDSSSLNNSVMQTSTVVPSSGNTTNPTASTTTEAAGATASGANGTPPNANNVNMNNGTTTTTTTSTTNATTTATSSAPELPPRRPDERVSSSSNFELTEGDIEHGHDVDSDLTAIMREYPWFHSTLPRAEASSMVLHGGSSSHGVFLVRQSETRKGEFVLTFNFQGRAKHLRMTLNDLGQCRVQHLWFPTITEMLEHFRQNSIPLEQGGVADVRLTEYVVHQPTNNATGSSQRSQVLTMPGSVRIKTCDLELSDLTQESTTETPRAVDNQYSFV